MGKQQKMSCEFCGGNCPEHPPIPPDTCTCRGCVVKPSTQRSELNCGAAAAVESEIGERKREDEVCVQLPMGGEKKGAQHGECTCLRLRQLCCGSYARYLRQRARLKESWKPRPLDSLNKTDCSLDHEDVTPQPQMQHPVQRQEEIIVGDGGALSCEGGDSARDDDVFWVFGYGSLIWKTDGLPAKESVFGYIKGFKRVFFQLSEDHRGTPSSPGLVANLLPIEVYADLKVEMSALLQVTQEDSDLTTRCTLLEDETGDETFSGQMEQNIDEGIVHGVALKFSQKDLEVVLEKLDYREKGGYSRVLVEFFPLKNNQSRPVQHTHKIHAFVYMGLPCNRHFYCFPDFPLSQNHDKWSNNNKTFIESEEQALQENVSDCTPPGVEEKEYKKREDLVYCRQSPTALLCCCCPDDATHAAKMILRGKGVSGPNTKYLFSLADFLRSIGQVDEHVFGLEDRVKQMMGIQVHQHKCTTEMSELTDLN